jgi:quaternary ammonium compound-resistance protein SugE
MAWLLLILAGVLEVAWAYFLKLSDGFTRLAPAMITIATMTASFALLAVSMKTLPLGTAYTIWTGIGAVGAFLVGLVILDEPASATRIVAATMLVGGLVMMKLS